MACFNYTCEVDTRKVKTGHRNGTLNPETTAETSEISVGV